MNHGVAASDVPNIQIAISPHDQSHDQTTSPSAISLPFVRQDLKRYSSKLHWYARTNKWSEAKPIVEKNPEIVKFQLTGRGDTAVHVAADAESIIFMEELVQITSPENLLIQNFQGMLPVHLAVLTGLQKMVLCLCCSPVLNIMAYRDIKKLFFMAISNNMFEVAVELFQTYSTELGIAREEETGEKLTALHMLARKSSEILNITTNDDTDTEGLVADKELFMMLWQSVRSLEYVETLELITQPSVVFFDAIKSGHSKAVRMLFKLNPELLVSIKDPSNGRNLLHLLFQYRHYDYFTDFIDFKPLLRTVDKEGNNVLHLAAHLPLQSRVISGLLASKQMQREFAWFKTMVKRLPPELRSVRNKKGEKPIDVFYDQHRKLSEEIQGAAKGIAQSGMLVATLVATVAFASALTTPGGKTNNAWFIVFIFTNAVALFTSAASILCFLSNFTSLRFAESEFVISLHPSLTFGPALLMVSVVAMVVAFTAASFLIFDHATKWISYVVASMGVFPLLLFLLFQFRLFDEYIWSRYYRPKHE